MTTKKKYMKYTGINSNDGGDIQDILLPIPTFLRMFSCSPSLFVNELAEERLPIVTRGPQVFIAYSDALEWFAEIEGLPQAHDTRGCE